MHPCNAGARIQAQNCINRLTNENFMDHLPDWPILITPQMAFGLMLLIGAIGGYLAHLSSWVPSITGFMAVGLLFGPSGIGLLSQETMVESHLHELSQFTPVVLALVLARVLAKMLGVVGTSEFLKQPRRRSISSGLLLLPMAGLAIGLAQTSSTLFPQHAATVTAIVLGAVTVFESIGPPIAAFAFKYAGEVTASDTVEDTLHPQHES